MKIRYRVAISCFFVSVVVVCFFVIHWNSSKKDITRTRRRIQYDQYKTYYLRSKYFDMHGYNTNITTQAIQMSLDEEEVIKRRWIIEGLFFDELQRIQSLCEEYDLASVQEDFARASNILDQIHSFQITLIKEWQKSPFGGYRRVLEKTIEKIECMFLRQMSQRENYIFLQGSDILKALPNDIFFAIFKREGIRSVKSEKLLKQFIFRNMLIIAQKIHLWYMKYGCFPRSLDELSSLDEFIVVAPRIKIHYFCHENGWKLSVEEYKIEVTGGRSESGTLRVRLQWGGL